MKRMSVKVVLALSLVLLVASVAFAGDSPDPQAIVTSKAPAAAGPYSQGIKYGDLVFVSGQLPLTPTGTLVNSDIVAATQQVMENIGAILKKAKLTFDDVLMTTVYLENMGDFCLFNNEYAKSFGCHCVEEYDQCDNADPAQQKCNKWACDNPNGNLPARATVAVSAIPKGALLEVSVIAGK